MLLLMPFAVGKAKVDGWAGEARRAMPLFDVERRLREFGGVWLGVDIGLQWIGEVVVYCNTCKAKKHDILPCSGPILTVPMPQSCLLSICGSGNARRCWWHDHRRRTDMGKGRRWLGDFI
jgi:hypothetical protein